MLTGSAVAALLWLLAWQPDAGFAQARATAQRFLSAGRLNDALPHLDRAHTLRPYDYATRWDLALALFETGALPRARALVAETLARGEKAELHALLGDIEDRAGQPQRAAQAYERAAQLDPSEKNLLALGNHLTKYSVHPAALEVFRQATGRYPNSGPLHVGLGVALHGAGRYDDAVNALCRAVDLAPQDPRAVYFLGQMHDISPALTAEVSRRLQRFVELYPTHALAHHYFGVTLMKRDPPEDERAQKHLATAAQLDPRNAESWLQLGIAQERLKRDADAERSWRKSIAANPRGEQAHYRLARLYQRTGRSAEAKRELAEYERVKPKR